MIEKKKKKKGWRKGGIVQYIPDAPVWIVCQADLLISCRGDRERDKCLFRIMIILCVSVTTGGKKAFFTL